MKRNKLLSILIVLALLLGMLPAAVSAQSDIYTFLRQSCRNLLFCPAVPDIHRMIQPVRFQVRNHGVLRLYLVRSHFSAGHVVDLLP